MTDSDLYLIWLGALTDVSVNSKANIIEALGSAENVFFAPAGEAYKIDGVTKHDAAIIEEKNLDEAKKIVEVCQKRGIKIITVENEEYPERLKEVFGAPLALFVKGELPKVDGLPALAIVGTRKATDYGRRMALDISYQYAKCGGAVISGLTEGVDEAAAQGAVAANGIVIGVLGTPITKSQGVLEDRILAGGGAIISEYGPGIKQRADFFRARNRITAGLSAAVCAIEAPKKSGTALFVAEALEQGKQIFALPGNADSEMSEGTLRFIKDGAMMITCGNEIAQELDYMFPGVLDTACFETYREAKAKKVIDKKNSDCYIDLPVSKLDGLTDKQIEVMNAIMKGALTADEIIAQTGLPARDVLTQLTVLEIKKIILRDQDKRIKINN